MEELTFALLGHDLEEDLRRFEAPNHSRSDFSFTASLLLRTSSPLFFGFSPFGRAASSPLELMFFNIPQACIGRDHGQGMDVCE
ncbi:uncharacterized protein LOC129312202 isoform X3 [Prosopis cineraria]|uniref:uncharacterized protein LOC129312202 isoform X3 n=1 Tax=Prosopis cineraria TaxID=364024 RepID=UPI002410A253|nr:uncharacterized protein LOC129312202 isoform X3 [Prosopis cineraria]